MVIDMETLERTQVVPLSMRQDGTIHVIGSRVTLDTVISRYKAGDSPEAIREGFPTLTLAQIHGVLQYYHEHRDDMEAYLRRREENAREVERERRSADDPREDLREMLIRRRASKTSGG